MEWDTNPLLREEIDAPRRGKPSPYVWSDVMGVWVLTYEGHAIARIQADGKYSLRWRERVHEGKAASLRQARRFMGRWLAARGKNSPMSAEHTPPSKLVPLADFLKDYEDGSL